MPAASLRRHRNDGTRPRAGRPKPRDGPVGKEYLWLAGLEAQPRDQAPVLRGKRPPPNDGRGIERYGSGKDSFTGEFRKGLKHGQGTMRWSDGREYFGTWKEGHRCGMGRLTKDGSLVYEGLWRDGAPNGRGIMVSPDGAQYTGELQAGRRHGSGLYTTCDGGLTYDGKWQLGRCHGRGTLLFASGATLTGEWHHGQLDGEAVFTRPSEEGDRVQTSSRLPVQLQATSTAHEAKSQVADLCGVDVTRLRLHDTHTGKEMPDGTTMRQAKLQDDDSLGVLAKVPFVDLPEGRTVQLTGLKEVRTTRELGQKIAETEHDINIFGYATLRSEIETMSWRGQEISLSENQDLALFDICKGGKLMAVVDSVSIEGIWKSTTVNFSRASPSVEHEGADANASSSVPVLEGQVESDGTTYRYEIDVDGRFNVLQ
jgi:hypothetical protein